MSASIYKGDHFNNLDESFNSLYEWIKNNLEELQNYDRIPAFHFEVYDHPLVLKCKESEYYTRFVNELMKLPHVSKRINTTIIFFGTAIELKEDYLMYQLIHGILQPESSKGNILKDFLKFFSSSWYSLEFKYSIQNVSFESFKFFSDKYLDIDFEKKGDQFYVNILMKANLWLAKPEPAARFYRQNVIEMVSICYELLTFNKIYFNLLGTIPSSLITLFPESNAIETQFMGEQKEILDSSGIDKLREFWKIFVKEYDNNYHSINLFHNARGLFYSNIDQFLYLIYCLESVIGIGSTDSLSFKISYRTSKLVTKDVPQRIEVREYVKSFYNDRSKFVHNGIGNIKSSKTERLRKYVVIALRNKILVNWLKSDFTISFSFKKYNPELNNKEIRQREIEAIIDYFEPLDHNIISYYNT